MKKIVRPCVLARRYLQPGSLDSLCCTIQCLARNQSLKSSTIIWRVLTKKHAKSRLKVHSHCWGLSNLHHYSSLLLSCARTTTSFKEECHWYNQILGQCFWRGTTKWLIVQQGQNIAIELCSRTTTRSVTGTPKNYDNAFEGAQQSGWSLIVQQQGQNIVIEFCARRTTTSFKEEFPWYDYSQMLGQCFW
jgi:hypothetical protein